MTPATSQFRIVLSWSEIPKDLDAHLVGPPTPEEDRFHVYWSRRNHEFNGRLYASLDVDVDDSFGPETITIHNFVDGVYHYYIQDFTNRYNTNSYYLANSRAVVRIYNEYNSLIDTFHAPIGRTPGNLWHVFSITSVEGEYRITPVNSVYNIESNSHDIGFRMHSIEINDDIDIAPEIAAFFRDLPDKDCARVNWRQQQKYRLKPQGIHIIYDKDEFLELVS